MIITPTIDPTIAVARPGGGQRSTSTRRAAVRPYANAVASSTVPTTGHWATTGGSTMSLMCAPGFAHVGNVGNDGSKRPDPGHLVGGLT